MHAVLLVYGPTQSARKSAARLRELVSGSVVAVAASPAGSGPLASLKGIAKQRLAGSAGLRAALADLPAADPVILIHDDVTIDRTALTALERSLDTGNRYVVPYSNDPGVDHTAPTLPEGPAGTRMRSRVDAPSESRRAGNLRPACLAGRAADLLELTEDPLPDPFTRLEDTSDRFVVAGGALVAHAARCAGRLVSADRGDRPLLVAALIVRDEEEMLPACLESLAPLVDRIEVCDTGSTDGTVALARAAGARVVERPWPDDFGQARNSVLDQCRDARYALVVDADERVVCEDPDGLRRYLATYGVEHPAFSIAVASIDGTGNPLSSLHSVRLFHAATTEYRGAVHELPVSIGSAEPLVGVPLARLRLLHLGYDDAVAATRRKGERNLDLAESQYAADPGPRTLLHLARSLSYAGRDPARALHLLERAWAESEDADPASKAYLLSLMADRHVALGDDGRAFDRCLEAAELVPEDDTALALLATTANRLGRHETLIAVVERVAGTPSVRPIHAVPRNREVFRSAMVEAYAAIGRTEEAVATAYDLLRDRPHRMTAWAPLATALLRAYGAAAAELLVPLALLDSTSGYLEPITRRLPPETTADFCSRHYAAGGRVAEVIRVGILAAAMASRRDLFDALAPGAADLDAAVVAHLAERVAAQGHPDWVAALRPATTNVR
jgi:tetratricopeptide (TPR) repeat protein